MSEAATIAVAAGALPAAPPARTYLLTGLALGAGGAVLFSTRSILIKLAYAYQVDPITFLTLRMVFSLPFFLAAAVWAQRRGATGAAVSRRDAWHIVGLGLLGYYFASYVDFAGLQFISASLSRLIQFLNPTLTIVIMALFFARRIVKREVAAMAVCYAGIALCLIHDVRASGNLGLTALGSALSFLSALCYAVYLILSNRLIARIGSLRFTAYAMTVSCVAVIVHFLLTHPLSALDLPWQVLTYGAIMALLCTVLPVFMVSEANRRIGPAQVGILSSLGPVATLALGFILLAESITLAQVAGMALVLGGVWLPSRKPRTVTLAAVTLSTDSADTHLATGQSPSTALPPSDLPPQPAVKGN